jgi:signal transduction histidine kinase
MTTVAGTPFLVLSAGNLTEASVPLARLRKANLTAVLVITAAVSVLFLVLLWRATRSRAELTLAADQVGRGNLSPSLPPARGDEVGRLSAAFADMIIRLRDSLAEIEQKRRLAVVGEFSSQISHEIRNPLTSIKLNLQTLERAVETGTIPDELREPVTISLREVQRLDRVVRGVLQLGRGKVRETTRFRLHDAVASAVAATGPAFARQRIRAVVDDRSNGHCVQADRALIEGVIMNILLNAAESMPGGGEVKLSTTEVVSGDATVNQVRVEDHGPGVAPDDRERIFTPFYTTKPDGSGLGLAIAQRTVEEHAGRLWVESRPDHASGATFVLELPTAHPQ